MTLAIRAGVWRYCGCFRLAKVSCWGIIQVKNIFTMAAVAPMMAAVALTAVPIARAGCHHAVSCLVLSDSARILSISSCIFLISVISFLMSISFMVDIAIPCETGFYSNDGCCVDFSMSIFRS